ncbi:cupredoxin-like domain protein [Candidatus Nitrosopelagicus brevis]|uniref:Cupredoxin-like domain protein n=2 Tax=Candidatus Nitrosopelagicus brevis TaxID=1410606 RepID=A0A0A7V8V8_9ARCH|nr:cupredoxin-like domain protein [Candidatus Nitrosopelagicus brevis]
MADMTSADKFGVIFSIAFAAAMIAIMGGLLQVDTTPATPSMAAPTQTYSPPPAPAAAPVQTPTPQAAPQTSSSDNLKYTIRGGIVDSISQDEHHNAVKIEMDSRLDGQITITVNNNSVKPFDDGTYFVTIDGEEVEFTQVGKRLTIDFMANSQKIMIYGEGYKSGGHDMSSMGHSEDSKEHEAMMAADKAAAEKAAADKAAAAAADKAAAEKAAAEKAAAEKAAADKAAAEKAAAAAAAAAKAPMAVTVEPVAGSGAPGCETTECYTPSTATISAGGTVTFTNTDTAPHTSTSGSAANGPDGVFDTSLIMMNASFDVTLADAGTYTYFCMVHPWMEGTIIVE